MGAKQQPGRGPILFLTRALLVFFYWSLFSFNIDFSLFPFLLCFFCYLYVIYLSLLGSPLRGPRGEPPPDVVSGENVTLPSSFIALRREAINSCLDQPTPGAPTSLSSHARCSKRIRAGREGWSAKSCLLRELPSCKFVS